MAITYSEAVSERQSRFAVPALQVAQSTHRESRRPTRSFACLALYSPLFAIRVAAQATAFTCELLELQIGYTKRLTDVLVKPPRKITSMASNAPFAGTADDVGQAADDGVQDAAGTVIDKDVEAAIVTSADGAAAALVTTTDDEIQLEAKQLINKQRIENGEARVCKESLSGLRSIDLPLSHEELVTERHAVASDVDVSEPIADGTIRIPLAEEKMNVTSETVVNETVAKEIVGSAKRRGAGVECISDIVRHEEPRANVPATIPATGPADGAVPAIVPISSSTTTSAGHEQATFDERLHERAYALWEAEGRPEGRQLDNWTQAEREIHREAALCSSYTTSPAVGRW